MIIDIADNLVDLLIFGYTMMGRICDFIIGPTEKNEDLYNGGIGHHAVP